jgi:hypothetical protein
MLSFTVYFVLGYFGVELLLWAARNAFGGK